MNVDKPLLGAQLIGCVALVWMGAGVSPERAIAVGDQAPEFSVTTDDGRKLSRGNFGGKLLVVNFWATWCPPCVYEMPSLSEFGRTLESRGVVVLAVSFDEQDGPYKFLERLQPRFLTTRTGGRELAASFGTFKIPETYIIDRTGRIVRKYVDARDWTDAAIMTDVQTLSSN